MGCQVYYYSGAYNPKLKRDLNIDQLFSFYHEPKLVIDTIKYKREHPEYTAKIMLDSGAFTHYQESKKKGIILTDADLYEYTDRYLEYLNEWGEEITCFVGVDSVPDPTNVDPTYGQKTWENYLYMYERLKPSIRKKLIPVFHYGEDFKWLNNFLEFTHEDGSHVEYIGLAISLEGTRNVRINWGQECMRIIRNSSNPNVKTHAFGVGVKSVLEHIDVTSTDATSWVKRAAYGMVSIDDKTIYVSDVQKEKLDKGAHYSERSKAYQEAVEDTIIQRGFRLDPEEVSYKSVSENQIQFTADGIDFTATYDGADLCVSSKNGDEKFELESQTLVEGETLEGKDKFFGHWEFEEKALDINGNGTLKYDNGTCLATNCYARARFNIIDTEMWMKDLRKSKVETLVRKVDLGW